jgi:hypothetical protein
MCPLPCPGRASFDGFRPRLGRLLREAHHHPVGHAQVQGEGVLVEDALLGLELGEAAQRVRHTLLGQAHVETVGHLQRPPPPGHEGAGADAAPERPRRLQERQVLLHPPFGLLADHEGQVGEAPVAQPVDHGAVGRHHEEFAAELPDRVGLALDERDGELVREQLADGGALDERHPLQPLARLGDAQKGERGLGADAGGGQNLGLRHLGDARQGDGLDPSPTARASA